MTPNLLGGPSRRTRHTAACRAVVLLAAAAWFIAASARPAAAHGSGGISATNNDPSIDGLTPTLSGVRIRLIEAGSRLEVRNDGPELIVSGRSRR